MKKKKLALTIVGLLSVVTLAACSGDKEIVSMKGGKITVDDFYQEIKKDQNTQMQLQNVIITKVADANYGDKVKDADVTKQVDDMKKQLGPNFKTQLKQAGMTEADYKENVKKSLVFQEMIKAHVKVTDKDIKAAWAEYHPAVDIQLVSTDKEADAKTVVEKAKNKEDFGKLAKNYSNDPSSKKEGKITFDSTNTELPDEVKTAAYKLKDGQVSDVITVAQSNPYSGEETKSFFVVKMVKNKEKGNDYKPYKKELTKIVDEQKLSDPQVQQDAISKELKGANIKVKDEDMKPALAQFIETDKKETKKDKK